MESIRIWVNSENCIDFVNLISSGAILVLKCDMKTNEGEALMQISVKECEDFSKMLKALEVFTNKQEMKNKQINK